MTASREPKPPPAWMVRLNIAILSRGLAIGAQHLLTVQGRRLANARVDSPAVDLMIPLALSGSGVFMAALAYYNRAKPQWQRDMRRLMVLAVGQVALGFVSYLVLVVAR